MNTHDQISELLTAFALGELSPQEAEEVENHLSECADCAVQLESLRAVLESAEALSEIAADEQEYESAKQSILETAASEPAPPVEIKSIRKGITAAKKFRLAAAAIIVIAATIGIKSFLGGTTTFARVIKNVINAKSISFQSRQRLGTGPTFVSTMYIKGHKLRIDIATIESDQPGAQKLKEQMRQRKLFTLMSNIADFESKDAIELDHFRNTYKKLSINDRMVAEFTRKNPVEQFRNVKPEDAEFLRTDSQEGRKIDVFLVKHVDLMGIKAELSGKEGERMTVWVDRNTSLPVRILLEASAYVEGKSRDFFEFYNFAWNAPLAEDTFTLDPPEGYKLTIENNPPIE